MYEGLTFGKPCFGVVVCSVLFFLTTTVINPLVIYTNSFFNLVLNRESTCLWYVYVPLFLLYLIHIYICSCVCVWRGEGGWSPYEGWRNSGGVKFFLCMWVLGMKFMLSSLGAGTFTHSAISTMFLTISKSQQWLQAFVQLNLFFF